MTLLSSTNVYRDVTSTMFLSEHKRFLEGCNKVKDEKRVGRPCSPKTDYNTLKINNIVQKDRR